eukprot:276792-Chlamydomonas_euryale.AAC.2
MPSPAPLQAVRASLVSTAGGRHRAQLPLGCLPREHSSLKAASLASTAPSRLPPSRIRTAAYHWHLNDCHNGADRHCEVGTRQETDDVLHYREYGPASRWYSV